MDDLVGCLKQGRKRNQTKTSYLIHLFLLPFTNMIVIYLFDPLARFDSFIMHQHSLFSTNPRRCFQIQSSME